MLGESQLKSHPFLCCCLYQRQDCGRARGCHRSSLCRCEQRLLCWDPMRAGTEPEHPALTTGQTSLNQDSLVWQHSGPGMFQDQRVQGSAGG